MQLNEAVKSFVYAQTDHAAVVDHHILERAAEALYEFVFSGCGRLDGKRCWERCDEETKEGFRREAGAVLDAVLPLFLPEIRSSHINRVAKFEHRF